MPELRIVTSDGTIHRAFEEDGVLFTAEGDNLEGRAPTGRIYPNKEGSFSYPQEPPAKNPCIRCFGRCGAVHGDDGERCKHASGHNDPHAFEHDDKPDD